WLEVNLGRPPAVSFERRSLQGEEVVVGVLTTRGGRRLLTGVSRLEMADGRISRHVGYFYCPETLAAAAQELGMQPASHGYHQDPAPLERMIGDARLPWRAEPARPVSDTGG